MLYRSLSKIKNCYFQPKQAALKDEVEILKKLKHVRNILLLFHVDF